MCSGCRVFLNRLKGDLQTFFWKRLFKNTVETKEIVIIYRNCAVLPCIDTDKFST